MTTYIVCLKTGAGTLEILGTQEAHSGSAANRKQAGGTPGHYIAVPVSNWTEEEISFEQPPPRAQSTKVEPIFPGQQVLPDPESDPADTFPPERGAA